MKLPATLRPLAYPSLLFWGWLTLVAAFTLFASAFFDTKPNLTQIAAQWDGGWYQSIISGGYSLTPNSQSNVAFFPLYPLAAYSLTLLGLSATTAAFTTSLVALWAALCVAYMLVRRNSGEITARITLVALLVFPFSFFFIVAYTESLFLLLVALALLLTQRKDWWLAAVVVGLASATKVIGVLLILVVIGGYIQSRLHASKPMLASKILALVVLSSSGLIGYMTYLHLRFGDALAFMHVQRFWPNRGEGVAGLKDVASNLVNGASASNPYALAVTEAAILALFIGLAVYCTVRINRWWGAWSLATLAVPLATGATTSLNRYVLILLPCFIALATVLRTWNRGQLVLIPSAMFLGLFILLFTTTQVFIG